MPDYVIDPALQVSVPVVGGGLFPVRRIYCVGRNYLEHIREMGGDERDPPFYFQKPTDAIVVAGADDAAEVAYPPITADFQHEVELVLAIGTGGRDITVENAAAHVFGTAVGIDLTRRDVQVAARKSGRPWEIGKAFDHSAPIAPIAPLDGALPVQGSITLAVNGEIRQSGNIAQLIWSCAEIIANLSKQYALVAGDLIYTGTPAGVGPVMPGDRIDAHVAGLPPLSFTVGRA